MTIKVLKSKIRHLKVTQSHINSMGIIRLPKDLMEAANLIEYEKVIIINESGKASSGRMTFAFVEESESGDITTPISIASANDEITVISTGSATVDEPVNSPIIIDYPL